MQLPTMICFIKDGLTEHVLLKLTTESLCHALHSFNLSITLGSILLQCVHVLVNTNKFIVIYLVIS